MTPQIVVWFKRDLRVIDHEPLDQAVREGQVLPLYVMEPDYWAMEYTSGRQWSFLKDSLISLDQELTALGQPLWILIGNAEEVLDRLYKQFQFCRIVSHQETGSGWTYERDLSVKRWSEDHGIAWDEYRQHGVVRGLQERRGWSSQWDQLMGLPQFSAPKKILGIGYLQNRRLTCCKVFQLRMRFRCPTQKEAAVTRYYYWIVFLMTVVRHTEVGCRALRLEKSHAHEYRHIYLSEH